MATVTGLQLKSTFFGFMLEQYSGTATGGAQTQLTDTGLIGYTSETWPSKILGTQLRMTGGLASGDLRMVGRFDASNGIAYPNRQFSAAVASTDTYEFWGTAINADGPLTNLFNDVLRALRPITDTQVTIVTNQRQYDVTTLVQSRRDISAVYVRLLDPNGIEPYRVRELKVGLDWWAYDRGGGTSPTVTVELSHALTLSPSMAQLWLRGETTFTPLVDDTSTVDAVYRDWLAWEAVLELSLRKLSIGRSDATRWAGLRDRAIDQLRSWRARWLSQPEPVQIATFP